MNTGCVLNRCDILALPLRKGTVHTKNIINKASNLATKNVMLKGTLKNVFLIKK